MDRLAIFAGDTVGVPDVLVGAALEAVAARPDVEIAAICVPAPTSRLRRERKRAHLNAAAIVKSLLDPVQRRRPLPPTTDLEAASRRLGFPIIVAPRGAANDHEFIARLRDEIRPTLALSLYWPRRFGAGLLEVFDYAVNYHNGALPAYRGLRATGWSAYRGDATTGYTFHRMTEGLDAGPVLVTGETAIDAAAGVADLDLGKALAAACRMPDVLRAMVARAPGVPQSGDGRYFSRADADAITTIESPSSLTLDELERRLRAFSCVRIAVGGEVLPVTQLRLATGSRRRNVFTTADGVDVEVTRVRYLPPAVFRLLARRLLEPS